MQGQLHCQVTDISSSLILHAACIWTFEEEAEKLDQCPIGTPTFSVCLINSHIFLLLLLLDVEKNVIESLQDYVNEVSSRQKFDFIQMTAPRPQKGHHREKAVSVRMAMCKHFGWPLDSCDHNCLQNIWMSGGKTTGLQGHHHHHCPWHVDGQT